MPQPTRSDVHVNAPLTNISIAYIQDAKDFVADQMFPNVPVQKQSDRYFSYDKGYWFRSGAKKRAPGSESAGTGFHIDNTPTYFADVYANHMDVDDQTRANQDGVVDLDRDATRFVTQQNMILKEQIFMAKYVKASVWSGHADFTPGTLWSALGSDPVADIETLKNAIKSQTGFMPNRLLLASDVLSALKSNAAVLDRIKYTQRGVVTEEILAALFGVEKLLISGAVLNSAAEGQSDSMAFMIAGKGLLCYAAPAPSILTPSAGYTFSWSGLFGAGANGARVSSFRMEHKKSDRIEGEMAFDMKLVGADLGCYMTGLIA